MAWWVYGFLFFIFHPCFFTKISTIKDYQAPAHTRTHTRPHQLFRWNWTGLIAFLDIWAILEFSSSSLLLSFLSLSLSLSLSTELLERIWFMGFLL